MCYLCLSTDYDNNKLFINNELNDISRLSQLFHSTLIKIDELNKELKEYEKTMIEIKGELLNIGAIHRDTKITITHKKYEKYCTRCQLIKKLSL